MALGALNEGRSRRELLFETIEAVHRTSASRLRANGRNAAARRAEAFASWAKFAMEDRASAARLRSLARGFEDCKTMRSLLDHALLGALALLETDLGDVQLFDRDKGTLDLVAQHGFDAAFVDHFQSVADDSTVCGRAAASGEQTVVDDIRDDSRFDGHRKALGDPIFRAVQSTPIVDYAGHVVGVISTHFRSASAPPARDLELMERYGQLVAEAAWRVRPSGA